MVETVQIFGGTLNQVLGDGVMALFGAPLSQEDHALRACCAAFSMHEAVAVAHSPVRLRVGLASGLTLLSTPGQGAAGAYPAFGDTIHLASRLQALARSGTTLCAASTRALAGPAVEFVALGPARFVVSAYSKTCSHWSASVNAPFASIDRLPRPKPIYRAQPRAGGALRIAQSVLTGASVAVAIVGDAGAGKSRLAWEFSRSLRPDTWQVIQAEAASYGRDVPYQLIGALLRSGFGIDERDEPEKSISRIRSQLGQLDDVAVYIPALLLLLALPLGEDATAWDRLDPFQRRDALRDSVSAVLRALTHRCPTLLLIEDLQWADDESLRLIDFPSAPDCRLLLVTAHRPDFAPAWTQLKPSVLALQPLSPDSMYELIQHAFPGITNLTLRRSTNISSCFGHVLSHLGQFDEAFDLLEQAAERTRRSGILVSHANELAWFAEAHRLAGRADQAARQAEDAVKVARSHEKRGNEALATVVFSEALADLGSFDAGKAHCVTALRLATEIGMAPLIQRCRAYLEASDQPVFG
jgi:tetratricopeptide (TPR) repeat protein